MEILLYKETKIHAIMLTLESLPSIRGDIEVNRLSLKNSVFNLNLKLKNY